MPSLKDVEERATAWLAKRDAGDWSEVDESALQAWLVASTAHRVAFLRLERIWEETGRLKVLAAGRLAGQGSAPTMLAQGPFFEGPQSTRATDETGLSGNPSDPCIAAPVLRTSRYSGRHLGMAASVLLVAGLGLYLTQGHRGDRFETPVGGTASVPLADGSHITLNTATKVRVELSRQERHVDLQKGEAFFVVAKDPKRPFVVEAGNKRVVAVGTQFSVRRDGENVEVVVTEGVVRLENRSTSAAAGSVSQSSTPDISRLPAGAIARVTGDDVLIQEQSVPEAESALSWRQGYLTFHETTLAEAVEEFNRYNARKLRIEDPKVAAIRISGTFRPTNEEAFVRLLQEGFSIDGQTTDESITLTQH